MQWRKESESGAFDMSTSEREVALKLYVSGKWCQGRLTIVVAGWLSRYSCRRDATTAVSWYMDSGCLLITPFLLFLWTLFATFTQEENVMVWLYYYYYYGFKQ